jgi:acyl-CoA synthetase (AMP-forming)/AMP-acid ligase II
VTIIFDGDPLVDGASPMAQFIRQGTTVSDEALASARAACGGRDGLMIVYTSGSTGRPKGAVLHHDGVVRFSLEQVRLWPLRPWRAINYFPINHVGCVIDCSTPTLVAGGTMVMMEQFDPVAAMELIAAEKITLWGSVPSVFQMQLSLPDFERFDLSTVQLIVWEGAAMPIETIERLRAIRPRLATNYGMTETTSAITIVEPTDDLDILSDSVGFAFPGVELRLAGPAGEEAAPGEPGEVQTRSPYNLLGYWRREEANSNAFTSDGFFRTGDLAVRRPDGRYKIVGRIKEMYKSGGYNVYPREVEIALEAHPAIAAAAVVSIPDELWQEVGVAYLTLSAEVSLEDLSLHCRRLLANYKVPKHLVIEPNLPLLPIGKIDKMALARRALSDIADRRNGRPS